MEAIEYIKFLHEQVSVSYTVSKRKLWNENQGKEDFKEKYIFLTLSLPMQFQLLSTPYMKNAVYSQPQQVMEWWKVTTLI